MKIYGATIISKVMNQRSALQELMTPKDCMQSLQNLICHSHPEAPLRLDELSDGVSCSLKPACYYALALS